MPELTWTHKRFSDLRLEELYSILRLRNEVFVVEQHCPYLDTDDKDQGSIHLCGWLDEKLVAYARLIPPGLAYSEASIGRVCTAVSYRGSGAGRTLMQKAIQLTLATFANSNIRIGAQLYLLKFYTSLGFKPSGSEYLEDGIPHIEMTYPQ